MIDLMEIRGYGIGSAIHKDFTIIHLYTPDNNQPLLFKDDTEFGAIRKVFKYFIESKGSKYD